MKIMLGAATLAPGAGGISVVARLSASALRQRADLRAISYLDGSEFGVPYPVDACGANKLRFAAAVHWRALQSDVCLYDSAGIGRAHPRLPGLKRPFGVWMHGIEVWDLLRPEAEAVLRAADRVFVNSHYTLARYESQHGPLPTARVCWLGTEDDAPSRIAAERAEADPDEAPAVLVLGRIDADQNYKGHRELIDAWPTVVASVPHARLVIAGGGTGLDEIRAWVAASAAAKSIDVLGFVQDTDIALLWRKASLFAMPSRKEGFGLVYVEAMRHGLPVIASTHDAAQEINLDGVTGFNVDLTHEGELAGRLIALLGNPGLRRRMGEAGEQRWREHFSFSRFQERFLPLFEEVAKPAGLVGESPSA